MQVTIGSKTSNPLPNGTIWPGVCVSEQVTSDHTIIDRETGEPVVIKVTRADFITLRKNREGDEYLALTNETVQFGFKVVAMPRLRPVIGLDVTADGTLISPEDLMDAHTTSYQEFAEQAFSARRGLVAADDL